MEHSKTGYSQSWSLSLSLFKAGNIVQKSKFLFVGPIQMTFFLSVSFLYRRFLKTFAYNFFLPSLMYIFWCLNRHFLIHFILLNVYFHRFFPYSHLFVSLAQIVFIIITFLFPLLSNVILGLSLIMKLSLITLNLYFTEECNPRALL